jgi:hypothetical protein
LAATRLFDEHLFGFAVFVGARAQIGRIIGRNCGNDMAHGQSPG